MELMTLTPEEKELALSDPYIEDIVARILRTRSDVYTEVLKSYPDLIVDEVALFFNVPREKIFSDSQKQDVTILRFIAAYLMDHYRKYTRMSRADIQRYFNVRLKFSYVIDVVSIQINYDRGLKSLVKNVESKLKLNANIKEEGRQTSHSKRR